MEHSELEVRMYSALKQHVGYLMAMTVVDWSYETGKISEREHCRLANQLQQKHALCAEA